MFGYRYQYKKAAKKARSLVDSWDRSVLGSFAIDDTLMVAVLATSLVPEKYAVKAEWEPDNAAAYQCQLAGIPLIHVESEIILWNGFGRIRLFDRYGAVHLARLVILDKVRKNDSSFIPYFEAGIWDVDSIANFIDSGIDADLAVSLIDEPTIS